MSSQQKKILFIYNAEAGFVNKLLDFTHKTFKPSTYPCSLCQLTHDTFSAKSKWTSFINDLDIDVSFLYKKELDTSAYKLPIVLLEDEKGVVSVLVHNKALDSFKTLDELILEIKEKLN